jgi:hypothetical protein
MEGITSGVTEYVIVGLTRGSVIDSWLRAEQDVVKPFSLRSPRLITISPKLVLRLQLGVEARVGLTIWDVSVL